MDAANADLLEVLFDGEEDLESKHTLPAGDSKVSFLLQDHAYGYTPNTSQGIRPALQLLGPANSDLEDPLRLLIGPNDIYESRSPAASLGSEGGASDTPCPDPLLPSEPPPPDGSPTVIYEVICDMGTAAEVSWSDPLFTRPLDPWTPPGMLPSNCIPSEASHHFLEDTTGLNTSRVLKEQLPLPGLCLTDEEQRLLSQEGVLLHNVLHLSKAEERILKKIRRKIRNKQSAQDSRRRKKEYLDGLESRAAACSAQNEDLKKKIQQLEKHKMSLLDQLRNLQGLLKETSSKAAQTSTCLAILLFSLGLFVLPSCMSFLGGSQVSREEYKPSGVISRNILTQSAIPELAKPPAAHVPEWPRVQSQLPVEAQATSSKENEDEKGIPITGGSASKNTSEAQRDPPRESQGRPLAKAASSKTDWDPVWPMHADEI